MTGFFRGDRGPVAVLLLLCAWLYLAGLGARDFWEPEEPEFALITRTMAERGDWVVPWQNGAWYAEKPPLVYWTAMAATGGGAAFRAGPPWEGFLARLPSALAGGALVLGLFLFARGPWGRRAAFLAALVLATLGEFLWRARYLQTDMLFAAATAGAVMCFLAADRHPGRRPCGRLLVGGWFLLGVGVLAKGPLGPVLAGLALASYLAVGGRARVVRALRSPAHLVGLAVFAGVALPWYLAVHGRLGPEEGAAFLRENLVVQNFGRTVDSYSHAQPPWYYLGALPAGMLPWTPVLLTALVALVRRARRREPDALALAAWFLPPFLLLSVISSKQTKYLLPLYPPLALAMGIWLDRAVDAGAAGRTLRWTLGTTAGLLLALGLAGPVAFLASAHPSLAAAGPVIVAALPACAAFLAGGTIVLVRLFLLVEPARGAADLAATVALGGGLALWLAVPAANEAKSARAFCEAALAAMPSAAEVAQYETFRSTYAFHLRRDTPVLKATAGSEEEAQRDTDRDARKAATREANRLAREFLDRPGIGFVIAQRDYWERFMDAGLRDRLDSTPVVAREVGSKGVVLLRERGE